MSFVSRSLLRIKLVKLRLEPVIGGFMLLRSEANICHWQHMIQYVPNNSCNRLLRQIPLQIQAGRTASGLAGPRTTHVAPQVPQCPKTLA